MTLKESINSLLCATLLRVDKVIETKGIEELTPLKKEIEYLINNFNKPLSVAVIGLIKAGKSTFINALMGEELLTTDAEEMTYTVTKFKYNENAFLEIQFHDGEVLVQPMEKLSFWTARTYLDTNERLNDVEMVTINYPNVFLQKIQIVDTPGFGSIHGVDSQNALAYLGDVSEEDKEKSTRLTKKEVSKADAVICAFANNMRKSDMNILKNFRSYFGESRSPSNSIGIFTKCDTFWDSMDNKPFDIGKRIADEYMERQDVKNVLYTLSPIIALPAQGLNHLNKDLLSGLKELSKIEAKKLFYKLRSVERFINNGIEGAELSADTRQKLIKTFGAYGVFLICGYLRDGYDLEEIQRRIHEDTGLDTLINKIIIKHFGARSDIIKSNGIVSRLNTIASELEFYNKDLDFSDICSFIYDEVDKIRTKFHCFNEMKMLQMYYNSEVVLDEQDITDLLHITGEYGYTCEERLNVEERDYSVKQMKKMACEKMNKWARKANSPLTKRKDKTLAETLKRSYEIVYYHLESLSEF